MSAPRLHADAVSVTVGPSTLVDTVTVGARSGEVLALVGPNGAGKSTLLGVMSGQLRPSSGEVRLDGCPITSVSNRQRARRVAVLPQRSQLAFPMPALEVVLLGRTPFCDGVEREVDYATAWRALEVAGVTHLAARSVATLSGGEQQRVHLARVLAQSWGDGDGTRSRTLLLDEPTASLDLGHAHAVLRAARAEATAGAAVVIVLHDLNEAAWVADRVAVLHRGRLVAEGRPTDCLDAELVQGVFGARVHVMNHPTSGARAFVADPSPPTASTGVTP